MTERKMENAPPLVGWTIATGAGAVAFGASLAAVGLDGNQSVFIGAVVALIVGTVFTVVDRALPPQIGPGNAPSVGKSAPAKAAPAAPSVDLSKLDGVRPQGISGPFNGTADDLQKITGIGPVLEQKLNGIGIYHYSQIAAWSEDEVTWVDSFLEFKGRIARDNWIDQARELASDATAKD
ncbi:hypothetical protein HUK65_01075 [Rhodobacteraceae bacterium 2376]|uniref:NADH-quinone oxidoreductase subunit E n=1 Tax=Rhabdonatronobacter sediminivivens TaxID=2743469 RepID=A0A7Z0HWD9_9RHOB|nr:hypothetical protein [Rhabdonatronobacter sediminivivens]NYS23566.1 hypothetical protein [Rhabdonatronobacter sediminivivens]